MNFELHEWHSLQLKNDFIEYLRKQGRLPADRLEDKCQIEQELEEYKGIEAKVLNKG